MLSMRKETIRIQNENKQAKTTIENAQIVFHFVCIRIIPNCVCNPGCTLICLSQRWLYFVYNTVCLLFQKVALNTKNQAINLLYRLFTDFPICIHIIVVLILLSLLFISVSGFSFCHLYTNHLYLDSNSIAIYI